MHVYIESSPPMTSTSSVVSLNGACSNAMSPGELESMNPKSMCRMCPSRVSSRLPSLRSLTCACYLHINPYIRVHSYVHAHIYPHVSRVSSRLPSLRSCSKHNPKRLPTMPRRRRYTHTHTHTQRASTHTHITGAHLEQVAHDGIAGHALDEITLRGLEGG